MLFLILLNVYAYVIYINNTWSGIYITLVCVNKVNQSKTSAISCAP